MGTPAGRQSPLWPGLWVAIGVAVWGPPLPATDLGILDLTPPARLHLLRARCAVLQDQGNYADAIPLFQGAADLSRELGRPDLQADNLTEVGWAHQMIGKGRDGVPALEEAVRIAQRIERPALESNAWNALALIERAQGEGEASLPLFAKALELSRLGADKALEAQIVANRANARIDLGDLEQALDDYRQAVDIYRAAGEKRGEGQALSYIGGTYGLLGQHRRALEYYEPALTALRSIDHSYQAVVHHRRGTAYWKLGDFAAALAAYEEAMVFWRKHGLTWGEGMTLAETAAVLIDRDQPGDLERASQLIEQALPISRANNDLPRINAALAYRGRLARRNGRTDQAIASFEEALTLWQRQAVPRQEAAMQVELARTHFEAKDYDRAKLRIGEAIRGYERMRRNFRNDELRATYLASVREAYVLEVAILEASGGAVAGFASVEQSRARVLLDLLNRSRVDPEARLPRELFTARRELESTVVAAQRRLQAGIARGLDETQVAARRAELEAAERARGRSDELLRTSDPTAASISLPEPAEAARVQRLLEPTDLLLEYLIGERQAFVLVVSRDQLALVPLAAPARIAGRIPVLLAGLSRPDRLPLPALAASHELWQLLIQPIEKWLPGHDRLLISPDGALHRLPFEALLERPAFTAEPANQAWLVRRFAVAYVPSASVLAQLRQSSHPARPNAPRFVAFADPTERGPSASASREGPAPNPGSTPLLLRRLRGGREIELPRLPESAREVRAIARLFPGGSSVLRLRADATERAVKQDPAVARAERLHFATHAAVDEEDPQQSGIVLSAAAADGEDGVLRLGEIYGLELDAELVVLSACETGLGSVVHGEGMVGLTRGFFFAGARRLLASLWAVEDVSTAELMVGFYRAGQTVDSARALRAAKLERLADPTTAHPFYWAGFVLSGDPAKE